MSFQTFNAEIVDAIFRERDQLEAENAKLRELVRDMFAMCTSDCLECEHGYDSGSCRLYDRMRELGIEDE